MNPTIHACQSGAKNVVRRPRRASTPLKFKEKNVAKLVATFTIYRDWAFVVWPSWPLPVTRKTRSGCHHLHTLRIFSFIFFAGGDGNFWKTVWVSYFEVRTEVVISEVSNNTTSAFAYKIHPRYRGTRYTSDELIEKARRLPRLWKRCVS